MAGHAKVLLMASNPKGGTDGAASRIGRSLRMEGTIAASGDLTISGRFKGTIEIPSKRLVVEPEGVVEADVKANQVVIRGTVRGNVRGIQRAALTSSADVVGKLETHELRVEEGAVFRGQVDILT